MIETYLVLLSSKKQVFCGPRTRSVRGTEIKDFECSEIHRILEKCLQN
jgi:hypothetical protein